MLAPAASARAESTDDPPSSDDADTDADADATAPPAYRTVVRDHDDDPLDAQRRADARNVGFVTAIDLEQDVGARPADSLPEVLSRSAGVHIRSLGGLGQFSSVSIRGSTGQQVPIFLDGVPVTGSMVGLFNLGDQPLDALERVEVYRGHVPIVFGGSTIGGAVNLVSAHACAREQPLEVSSGAGVGSFGSRQADVTALVPIKRAKRLCLHNQLSYAGSGGAFPFFDNGNTPLEFANDGFSLRRNNYYDRAQARVGVSGRLGRWRLHAQQLGLVKRQGLPGPANAQAERSTLDTISARTLGSLRRSNLAGPGGRLELLAAVSYEGRTYLDLRNELGLGADNVRTQAVDVYLSPRVRVPLWSNAFLGAAIDPRIEWIRNHDRVDADNEFSPSGELLRASVGGGIELEQFLLDDALKIAPAVRLDVVHSQLRPLDGAGEPGDATAGHAAIAASPRLGAKLALAPWLSFRTSFGRYFRAPTLFELYGDVGYATGTATLKPERGTSLDGGFIVDLDARPTVSLRAEFSGFRNVARDLIMWRPTGPVLTFENRGRALITGSESSLALALLSGDLELRGSYTWTYTRDRTYGAGSNNAPLFGRPQHDLFVRPSWGHTWRARAVELAPRLFYRYEHIGGMFVDPSGNKEQAPRRFHGVGLELSLARRWHIAAELRNLGRAMVVYWNPQHVTNFTVAREALTDFANYPLPGRSLWVTLRIELDPTRHADATLPRTPRRNSR